MKNILEIFLFRNKYGVLKKEIIRICRYEKYNY